LVLIGHVYACKQNPVYPDLRSNSVSAVLDGTERLQTLVQLIHTSHEIPSFTSSWPVFINTCYLLQIIAD